MMPTTGGRHIALSRDEGQIVVALYREGRLSRTDLARRLACSRAKAGQLVNALLEREILAEPVQAGGGRSRLVEMNPGRGYVAGVDIGTTSMDVALADASGRILRHQGRPASVESGPLEAVAYVETQIREMLAAQGAPAASLLAVGVGVPGPVRFPEGYIIGRHFLPGWDGFTVREQLAVAFPGAAIILDNDANVMALGEQRNGLAQGVDEFIFVKVGTGIGAGVVSRGRLLRGATSCAGHIGHTCVDFNGPICRCGNRGCLEAVAAGPAIAQAGLAAARSGASEILARLLAQGEQALTAEDVATAAGTGDSASMHILQESGRMIGDVLAGVVNLMNPELVVIGGGVSRSGYQLLTEVRRAILNRSYPYTAVDLRVEYSALERMGGMMGSVALALDWLFQVEGESLEQLQPG